VSTTNIFLENVHGNVDAEWLETQIEAINGMVDNQDVVLKTNDNVRNT
jgi:hypothetical protein